MRLGRTVRTALALAAVLTMPPPSAYTQTATVPGPYGIPQTGQAVPRALRTPTPHDLFPR